MAILGYAFITNFGIKESLAGSDLIKKAVIYHHGAIKLDEIITFCENSLRFLPPKKKILVSKRLNLSTEVFSEL